MSNLEGSQNPNPKKPADWTELDSDPKFQESFLRLLSILLLNKKFGKDFYESYRRFNINKAFESQSMSEFFKNPLIPEIAQFEEKIAEIKTVQEMFSFAKAENIEITPEEINEAKIDTIDLMDSEANG